MNHPWIPGHMALPFPPTHTAPPPPNIRARQNDLKLVGERLKSPANPTTKLEILRPSLPINQCNNLTLPKPKQINKGVTL